jgi:hypothetical protein
MEQDEFELEEYQSILDCFFFFYIKSWQKKNPGSGATAFEG